MEKAIAEALWKAAQKGVDAKSAVSAVNDMLAKQGRSALMPRVARAFTMLADQEMRRNAKKIYVAHEKDVKVVPQHEGADVFVDSSLIGGWRLEHGETLVDASWKKQLISIYNAATQ